MKSKLSLPPGPVMRRLEGLVVVICGLGCFLVYVLIRFDLCADGNCARLAVTKFHASLPELYLVYGIASILTGIYLFSNEQVSRAFRLGIETAIIVGFVLSGMIIFGMLIEIRNVT